MSEVFLRYDLKTVIKSWAKNSWCHNFFDNEWKKKQGDEGRVIESEEHAHLGHSNKFPSRV